MGSVLKLPPGIGRKKRVVNVKHLKDVGNSAPSGHFTIDEVQKAFAEVMDQSSLDSLIREAVGEAIEKAMPSQDLDAKLSEMESEESVESEVIKAEGGEGGDLPEAPGGDDEEGDEEDSDSEKKEESE